MDRYTKSKNQKLVFAMHLVKINIISSLAILLIIVVTWTLLLASVTSFLGVIAAGLGIHNFVALILAFLCYRRIGNYLAEKEVVNPYRISFIYVLLFVMCLTSIGLIRTKTGFINVDPEIVGFKYISDTVVYIFCIFIGTISIPTMALLQRYKVASFLILALPVLLFIYSKFFFVGWSSLPYYSIKNSSAETIRKHESLQWYIAPSESLAGLLPEDACEIVVGMKEVTCEYSDKERYTSSVLIQTIAKYHKAMDDYFESNGMCNISILKSIAQSEFGNQYKAASYDENFFNSTTCSSFTTILGTKVYFEAEDRNASGHQIFRTYFKRGDTVVLLEIDKALGNLSDEAFQKQLGAYVDSFK
jgi:hypothetical protein